MSVVYPRISGSIGGTPNYLKEIKATIEKVYLDEDG